MQGSENSPMKCSSGNSIDVIIDMLSLPGFILERRKGKLRSAPDTVVGKLLIPGIGRFEPAGDLRIDVLLQDFLV